LVFKQVKTFLAPPNLTAPPQTPGLDPPLVNSHQSAGRWFIFMCFVVRIFWRN